MAKYLILGDVHAKWVSMAQLIRVIVEKNKIDGVIQCGDFGIFPFYIKTLKQCIHKYKLNVPIYFVDGNHEDHYFLHREMSHKSLNKSGVFYQKRSTITVLGGRTIGWVGGALHVDRKQEDAHGLPNYVSQDDVANYLLAESEIDHLDLMVTHSCPGDIGIGLPGHPMFQYGVNLFISQAGHKASPVYDIGEMALTDLWNKMKYKPKNWVFGHCHKHHDRIIDQTHFYCVGEADDNKAVYFWNTDNNEITAVSVGSILYN